MSTAAGGLCVGPSGTTVMLQWPAGSWGLIHRKQVRSGGRRGVGEEGNGERRGVEGGGEWGRRGMGGGGGVGGRGELGGVGEEEGG